MPMDTLITILTFQASHEAHLAKAQLESCGIEAYLLDDHVVGVQPLYGIAVGGVKLQVFVSEREEALSVLGHDISMMEVSPSGVEACPECGSPEIGYHRTSSWQGRFAFAVLTILLLGIPWVFRTRKWQCRSCRHIWK